MRHLTLFFSLVLLLSSCACFDFSEPELRGNESVDVVKFSGQSVQFAAQAKIYNPNCFNLKVKPSDLELYVEDEFMGILHLDKKVKIKKRSETDIEALLTAELEDGALFKAMKYAGKSEIKVRLKGKVKGGVFIFSKKFEIDETKSIPGASLRMGSN